jgi:hypothetical protein
MLYTRGAQKKILSLILVLLLSSSLLVGALDSLLNSIAIGKSLKGTGGSCESCQGTGGSGGESVKEGGGAGKEGTSGAGGGGSSGGSAGGTGGSCESCQGTGGSSSFSFGERILVEGPLNPHSPLFEVHGVPMTRYLRVSVGEVYRSGFWEILNKSLRIKYQGEPIEQTITSYMKASYVKFNITPLVTLEGFIPSSKNPLRLSLPKDDRDLYYYPSQQIFFSKAGVHDSYRVEYIKYEFDERDLASASMPSNPRYLDVPRELFLVLKPLAQKIVETYGAKTPYEKLKAIEAYLRSNYVYDKNYTRPPSDYDPILWFLFHEKKGVCIHFNSAFVLLARTLGLPARLVVGFLIDPHKDHQVVYADQLHAYAEALFDGFGWITFDATGCDSCKTGGEVIERSREREVEVPIKTITEVSYVDEVGIKGSTFRVLGKVLDERGLVVSGLLVKVYLKRDKNGKEPEILVGQGVVENGIFNITCSIPLNIPVGGYSVIAETVGGGRYLGSRSDPEVKVVAKTYISANCPEKVIAGRSFSVAGFLREEGSNLPVGNKSITLICGSREYRVLTDGAGRFSIDVSIAEPGNHTLILKFDGAEYYLSSDREVRLRVLSLGITPLTNNIFVRGEDVDIVGIVHAKELVGDNEVVIVYFDGLQVTNAKTDASGRFSAKYHVPRDHVLGRSTLKYQLQSNGFEVLQEVKVVARTHMSIQAPEEPVESGRPFNIIVTLLNDLEEPIPGVLITFNCTHQGRKYFENATTNEQGKAFFNLSLAADREGLAKYRLTFLGNELYLGTEFTGDIKVVPSSGPPITYYAYLPLVAIAASGPLFAYFLRRRGPSRGKKTSERGTEVQEAMSTTKPVVEKKSVELAIKFPDIREPFPLVWGLNEKLTVRVEVRKGGMPINGAAITLSVDDKENIYLKTSLNGTAETQLTFTEKGLHRLRAHFAGDSELSEATVEASIKIVDYREEVVDLFNSFIKSALAKYQGLQENMTAREIQCRLLKEVPESKRSYLEDLVSIFEVANYSLRPITRVEYEKFFLAKLSLEA